jgi:hypothetical protein
MFAVAADGLLPTHLTQVHPHYRSPTAASFLMTSIETLVVIGLGFAGVAPYLGIASGSIGLGTVGIIAMQLVCAFAVVGFYTGEELPGLLTLRALDSNMHGTASVSGHFVPPKATLPASATILIRGNAQAEIRRNAGGDRVCRCERAQRAPRPKARPHPQPTGGLTERP